jgi:glycosyltransferase involved in cell wall biosynthesis
MNILHTEASTGWGGQEMRILAEAEGLRTRGHTIVFAVQHGARLAQKAREKGFVVYEISFQKKHALAALWKLHTIIRKHAIEVINTHSSNDAWVGGIAGRLFGKKIVRTRHLSAKIRPGLNSKILYRWLADYTVTTCEAIAEVIRRQAALPSSRCSSIPTGVDPEAMQATPEAVAQFRQQWQLKSTDIIIGTVCILRSWKGLLDMLEAAKKLKHHTHLKWIIVGSGSDAYFRQQSREMGVDDCVIFTGHLENPFPALANFDIFTLLSTANEGVSQASLQAAYFAMPMITTPTGGLPEVCLNGITGYVVPINAPQAVADKVWELAQDRVLRQQMGAKAKQLVLDQFTRKEMLDQMESVFAQRIP